MIDVYDTPDPLPKEWDDRASSLFQRRSFLSHVHKTNPCGQRYFVWREDEGHRAFAVCYRLKLDLLTFSVLSLKVPVTICGLPVSVSEPGIFGDVPAVNALASHLRENLRGLVLILNTYEPLAGRGWVTGPTLPNCALRRQFADWAEYYRALRYPYRRRVRSARAAGHDLTIRSGALSEFTREHHCLYRAVFDRSQEKLEFLEQDFFEGLSEEFTLVSYYDGESLVGWYVAVLDGESWVFFLCGFDYDQIQGRQVYVNILLDMVRRGIESGAQSVVFGQTSERAKAQCGARLEPRFMAGAFRSGAATAVLRVFKGALQYDAPRLTYRVFKEPA